MLLPVALELRSGLPLPMKFPPVLRELGCGYMARVSQLPRKLGRGHRAGIPSAARNMGCGYGAGILASA